MNEWLFFFSVFEQKRACVGKIRLLTKWDGQTSLFVLWLVVRGVLRLWCFIFVPASPHSLSTPHSFHSFTHSIIYQSLTEEWGCGKGRGYASQIRGRNGSLFFSTRLVQKDFEVLDPWGARGWILLGREREGEGDHRRRRSTKEWE